MGDRCGASKNGSKAKAGLEASTLPIMKARSGNYKKARLSQRREAG